MKRLAKLPTDRFIYPGSEPMLEPQPLFDGWLVLLHEPVRIEHVEQPNLYAELMESVSRVVGIIAFALVTATIIAQLTKRHEELPVVSERVQWGAR